MTDERKDLLDKLKAVEKRRALFASGRARPGETVIERVLGPCEVVINGKPTLMFGSNNYLGLTLEPAVVAAARDALLEYGTGTTGSTHGQRHAVAARRRSSESSPTGSSKRHALIFSTGYQANLSLIGGLCGVDDTILIDGDSHASIYDATRHTASQVVAFRHNSPESLRKKLERLPAGERNRLVVVEGLYSIRGDVAPLKEIVDVCRGYGAYLLVDEAHSLGTYGATRARLRRSAGRPGRRRLHRRHVLEVAGGRRRRLRLGSCRAALVAFSRPRLRVHGVRIARRTWPACGPPSVSSAITRSFATGSGRTSDAFATGCWSEATASARPSRRSCRSSPGEEQRTIALWQELLAEGLYVNLIVPPGCAPDECVLRASCSAAHTVEQITQALEIFDRVGVARQPHRVIHPAARYQSAVRAIPSRRSSAATMPSRSRSRSTRQTNPSADSSTYRQRLSGSGLPRPRATTSHAAAASTRDRLRDGNHDGRTSDGEPNRRRGRPGQSPAADAPTNTVSPLPGCRERGGDRPDDVVDVNERVRGVPPADERQQAQPGALEQRQQRPVAWTIDDARAQDRPAQSRHGCSPVVRRPACCGRTVSAGSARRPRSAARWRRPDRRPRGSRRAPDAHQRRRRHDDGAGTFDVDGGVLRFVERVDDPGEMNDGVDALERLAQGGRLERRSNDRGAAGHVARRLAVARRPGRRQPWPTQRPRSGAGR